MQSSPTLTTTLFTAQEAYRPHRRAFSFSVDPTLLLLPFPLPRTEHLPLSGVFYLFPPSLPGCLSWKPFSSRVCPFLTSSRNVIPLSSVCSLNPVNVATASFPPPKVSSWKMFGQAPGLFSSCPRMSDLLFLLVVERRPTYSVAYTSPSLLPTF